MSKPSSAAKPASNTKTYPFMVYIQFDGSKKVYTFGTTMEHRTGEAVVVETVRGQEIGTVYVPSMPFDASKVQGDLKASSAAPRRKTCTRKLKMKKKHANPLRSVPKPSSASSSTCI
ncbi:hypothetical protein [Allobaculum sp. Allo2]|uniref:hypothetical protein n=1 Tax=Allobaculum sp. Allo2 TaxID=2853432 RepID=UPI001F60EEAE|nr:hypothetical protein [Allobaculum sp. Allo2]